MRELIQYFLDKTIPDMRSDEFGMSYIKFIFPDDVLTKLEKYNKKTIDLLREDKKEYETNKNQENIYIKVDDYKRFFALLYELVETYRNEEERKLRNCYNYIRSIWLRMSPTDINDVNNFLTRELLFLRNSNLFPYYYELYKEYNGVPVYYKNARNLDWFETCNNLTFFFYREGKVDEIEMDFEYALPAIHYGFIKVNGKVECYIYGLQRLSKEKDGILKEKTQSLRKELQNKYVSPDFVLALKIFIDFLGDIGVHKIKVPLLQVFNYAYHKHTSRRVKKNYNSFENKEELEKRLQARNDDELVSQYKSAKNMYERFADKEDLISKNKTERLIETFMVIKEKFNNIEFLTDPFIEGDYLIINIKKVNKKRK